MDNVPDVAAGGQGGLLDIALDPNFELNKFIYISYSEPRWNGTTGTSVAKARFERGTLPRLDKVRVLFRQNNPTKSKIHFGSRLVLASDNMLIFTIGDRGQSNRAQDPFDHAGSMLRIKTDGSIQPTILSQRARARPLVHRPSQPPGCGVKIGKPELSGLWNMGLPEAMEINTPAPGKNYGWPIISYGTHYSGAKIGIGTH